MREKRTHYNAAKWGWGEAKTEAAMEEVPAFPPGSHGIGPRVQRDRPGSRKPETAHSRPVPLRFGGSRRPASVSVRVGQAFLEVLALARQFAPLPCKLGKVGADLVAAGHCGHVLAIPSARKIVLYLGAHAGRLSPPQPRHQTGRGPRFC